MINGPGSDHSIINGAAGDQIAGASFAALTRSTLGPLAPSNLPGIYLSNSQNASSEAVKHAVMERGVEGARAITFCGASGIEYPDSKEDESKTLE